MLLKVKSVTAPNVSLEDGAVIYFLYLQCLVRIVADIYRAQHLLNK